MAIFDGFLMAWDGFDNRHGRIIEDQFFDKLKDISGLKPRDSTSRRWRLYTFTSKISLSEDAIAPVTGNYDYEIIFRVNIETGNVIIAAESKEISENLIKSILN